jgi:hypothetical protein
LVTDRSATSGVRAALAWLLDEIGSIESVWLRVAVLVCVVEPITVAKMVRTALPPLASEPIVHSPLAPE